MFEEEITTIWSFKERGDWSNHRGDYPGNCSPKVVRNLICKYTKKGDLVLDQFIGSGTTAIEALLLERKIIGFDINEEAVSISRKRIKGLSGESKIMIGNAEKLNIKDENIDFIFMHPPYLDIIKYSKSIKYDFSLLSREEFFKGMKKVANESYRVLKKNCKCSVLVGDIRKQGYIFPLGFKVMDIFIKEGFKLKEIIIKEQHNCKSTSKWIEIAKKRNFLLIKHEYIFVFEKTI